MNWRVKKGAVVSAVFEDRESAQSVLDAWGGGEVQHHDGEGWSGV